MTDPAIEPDVYQLAPSSAAEQGHVQPDLGVRQIFVDEAGQKMGRARQIYAVAAEEISAVYQYGVFQICDTQTKVGFFEKTAEIRGVVDAERRALVEQARSAYLGDIALAQQDSAIQIRSVADGFAEREVRFGEFVMSIVRGDKMLSLGIGAVAIERAKVFFAFMAIVAVMLLLLELLLYLGSSTHRIRVARGKIRAIGREARERMDVLSTLYVLEVRHVLS